MFWGFCTKPKVLIGILSIEKHKMWRQWLKQIGAPFILSHKEQFLSYTLMNNELFLIRYFSFITYEIKPQNGQRHPLLQKAQCDRKKCRKCGLHVLCGDIIYALTIHSNNTDRRSIYGQSTAPLVPSFSRRRWLKWDLREDTEQIQTTAVGGIFIVLLFANGDN